MRLLRDGGSTHHGFWISTSRFSSWRDTHRFELNVLVYKRGFRRTLEDVWGQMRPANQDTQLKGRQLP